MKDPIRTLAVAASAGGIVVALGSHFASAARIQDLEDSLRSEERKEMHGEGPAPAPQVVRERILRSSGAPSVTPPPSSEEEAEETELAEGVPEVPREDQRAYLAHTFDQQTSDRKWAHEAELTLNEKLEEHLGDSLIEVVECRQDLCQVVLDHQDKEQMDAFVFKFVGSSHDIWPGEISTFQEVDENGAIVQTFYFARPGSTMPSL